MYVVVSILSAAFPGAIVYLLLWILIPVRRPGDAGAAKA
jgi:phage shock protein PspC (stress-responsive transcriptional regulator)